MSSSNFAEQSELLRRRLDTVANAPTLSPSPFPFTKEDRDFSEIFSYSVSLGNRLIIGAIILTRLWRYHKSGVLRWSELKTKFHVLLIFTVPMYTPYYVFCIDRYDLWQCYVDISRETEFVYRSVWIFYGLYRIGLSLQLVCLSITVLTWSDFLSYSERAGRIAIVTTIRHKRLVQWLFGINCIDITVSCLVNGYIAVAPEVAEVSNGGSLTFWVYLNWLFLDSMQLSLCIFLMVQGTRLVERIQHSTVFESQQKLAVVRKLKTVLVVVTMCILAEIICRIIGSFPLMLGTMAGNEDWRTDNPELYETYRFLEVHHILWQFGCYILPYDCVSFCLLYLMRADPTPRNRTEDFGAPNLSMDSAVMSPGGAFGRSNSRGHGASDSFSDGSANPLLTAPLLKASRGGGDHHVDAMDPNTLLPIGESMAGESMVSQASAMNEEGAFGGGAISQYQYGDSSPDSGPQSSGDFRSDASDSLSSSFGGGGGGGGGRGLSSPRSSLPADVAASLVLTGRGEGRSSWTEAVYKHAPQQNHGHNNDMQLDAYVAAAAAAAAASSAPTQLE